MSLPFFRRALKLAHPEAIPGLGAAIYNRMSGMQTFQSFYELLADDILSHCAEGSILDIGTGPAWLLVKLRKKSSMVRPIGIDVSPAMVEKAEKNIAHAGLSEQIRLHEGNAAALPFDDETMNAVVSTGSLHHWKHPIRALDEAYRVLAPGGWALIYDAVSDAPTEIYRDASKAFGRLRILLFWLHTYEEPFYSERDFIEIGRQSRLERIRSYYVGLMYCLAMTKSQAGGGSRRLGHARR